MNNAFDGVKKNFGFGCMRLPMKDGEVDYEHFCLMVDEFIAQGFNYFDTAHGYIEGKSEVAIRECISKRYERDKFVLTNKLSGQYFSKQEDIRPFFESQLQACGVEYFDYYLMHAQNAENFKQYKECKAYETAFELKKEGKVKHVGLSFHDSADVLDAILTEYPQVEVVQIQLNYVDYDDPIIQGKKCYEVCRKHDKPVIIMEPVKGGMLVELKEEAEVVLNALNGGSPASYAIRYTAGFDGVKMVLSGMSNMEQMQDNLSYMKDFKPLNEEEISAIDKVVKILNSEEIIKCTRCGYCEEGCPAKIAIPRLFSCYNAKLQYKNFDNNRYEYAIKGRGKPTDCVECGLCEKICPQHLPIRQNIKKVASVFEK